MTSQEHLIPPGRYLKRVALIGSSGGNLSQLGGDNPAELIAAVAAQLARGGMTLVAVCFIAADRSLDVPSAGTNAQLWQLEQSTAQAIQTGPLSDIARLAQAGDEEIADLMAAHEVDGLIYISADPAAVNRASVQQAAKLDLPAAGSGGSSIAAATALGVRFVAVSGTTGTSNETRAISYAAGLAREWKLQYRPADLIHPASSLLRRLDPRAVLAEAMPALLAVAAVIGLCRRFLPSNGASAVGVLLPLIGVSVSVVAAMRISQLSQSAVIAGVMAGVVADNSGLPGALLAGFLAGLVADALLVGALRTGWPATSANILGTGAAGVVAGGAARLSLERAGPAIDNWGERTLRHALAHQGWVIGVVLGALMWPILLRGLYHSVLLPLMAVEFSASGASFLAVMDMACLVAVSAGFALASLAFGPPVLAKGSNAASAARRTLRLNLGFGTYVEGSLPLITAGAPFIGVAVLAGAAGGAVAGQASARGVTYVPPVVLPLVGSPLLQLLLALGASMSVAFLGAGLVGVCSRKA